MCVPQGAREEKMKARKMSFAVLFATALLSFGSVANAQQNPYGPPSDQIHFDHSNIVNYSSNTQVGPPSLVMRPSGNRTNASEQIFARIQSRF
jgi:hypothetical protein